MRAKLGVLAVLTATVFMTGCASVVTDNRDPITFNSYPEGATVTIMNKYGTKVQVDKTPFTTFLSTRAGYFKSMNYTVVFEKNCYLPTVKYIKANVSRWYWGNFILGGPIGLFVVDPLTGSMFKLSPPQVSAHLVPLPGGC